MRCALSPRRLVRIDGSAARQTHTFRLIRSARLVWGAGCGPRCPAGLGPLAVAALGCACTALACATLAGTAWAGNSLTVQEAFTPDVLGAATNLSITAGFTSSADVPPAPISRMTLYGPAGLGIDARGAGMCSAATLEQRGPAGCPADSRVGFGGGVAVLALPGQLVREPFTLDFFFGSRTSGRLRLLAYASGISPVAAELVVAAREIPTPAPYGIGFTVEIPQVATIPGAEYVSIESAYATIGASDVAYYRTVRGRRMLVRVPGLIVPRRCPAGGFPTRGIAEFADGATFTVDPAIPCPRG